MRFHVVGADKETGNDIEIEITATDRAEAEGLATKRGVLVSAVQPIKDADPEEIALVDIDMAPAGGTVAGTTVAAAATKSGTIAGKAAGASVAGASAIAMPSPGASHAGASSAGSMAGVVQEAQGSISGAVGASTSQPGAHMEYHIIMNQSLYLLEVAVNKHLKDGWEPQGGLTVGMSNNANQFYQAMIRHKD